jgi:hypothetical protein
MPSSNTVPAMIRFLNTKTSWHTRFFDLHNFTQALSKIYTENLVTPHLSQPDVLPGQGSRELFNHRSFFIICERVRCGSRRRPHGLTPFTIGRLGGTAKAAPFRKIFVRRMCRMKRAGKMPAPQP